ncbi:MAG: hydantoinase/oxoprolinase family protein, partial [Chloroflexi bacterium]|nr:hydantoinase/oxoprolinase family protein [Chloroflexota bacterium]
NFEVNAPVPSGSRLTDSDFPKIIENFNREHEKLYGHSKLDEPVEFVSLRVTAVGVTEKPRLKEIEQGEAEAGRKGTRRIYFKKYEEFVESGIYERSRLPAGSAVVGPAVVEEMDSTGNWSVGHRAVVDRYGNLVITLE